MYDDIFKIKIENEKFYDQVFIKNKSLNKNIELLWNDEDCDNKVRSYIQSIDYKNRIITMSIWMENIDVSKVKISTKNNKFYLTELYSKTHYFEKVKECTYRLRYALYTKDNLSPIIYEWLNKNEFE